MGIVLPFTKLVKQKTDDISSALDDAGNSATPKIGYQEYNSLMQLKAITFYRDNERRILCNLGYIIPQRDSEKFANPDQDRVEWHFSNSDYIYWFLSRMPERYCIRLSETAGGGDYLLRYDEEAFAPVLKKAKMKLWSQRCRNIDIATTLS